MHIPHSLIARAVGPEKPILQGGGAPRSGVTSFTINGKGYMGTGYDDINLYQDFWQYDPQTDAWTQKATFPGAPRFVAVGIFFSVGDKGYFGTGWNGSNAYDESDFWEYNATDNSWTLKAGFPGGQRNGAVGFSIGDKGYVGTGFNITDYPVYFHQDFWQYDPATDEWTRKADLPGPGRQGGVGFSIGSKGYIALGGGGQYSNLNEFYNDLWEYDPEADAWNQKADLPADGRQWATGFTIGEKGYIGTGGTYPGGPHYADFWQWDQGTNTWSQQADFAGGARNLMSGFAIGSKGYIGTGHDGTPKNDFWEFTAEGGIIGANCATAIDLGQGDTCFSATISQDSVVWFRYIATTTRIIASATSAIGGINSISLASDNCITEQHLARNGSCSSTDSILKIDIDGLNIGRIYLLKVQGTPGFTPGFCIEASPPITLQNLDFESLYRYSAFAGGNLLAEEMTWLDGMVAGITNVDTNVRSAQVMSGPSCERLRDEGTIQSIRAALNSFPGNMLPAMVGNGQNIEAGIFEIMDHATMQGRLNVSGDSALRMLIRIHGNLTVSSGTKMILEGMLPRDIIWVVDGNVQIEEGVIFFGVVIAGGSITYNTVNSGWVSLHAQQNILLKQSCSSSASDKFLIGMFSAKYLHSLPEINYDCTVDPLKPYLAITSPALPGGGNSSQLNVLAEDGFNAVLSYNLGPGGAGQNEIASYLQLVKNNRLQTVLLARDWYIPNTPNFGFQNVYNDQPFWLAPPCDPDANNPNAWCLARPNYEALINNVYSASPSNKCVILGYQITEEAAYKHFFNDDWCKPKWFNESGACFGVPPANVSDALLWFKNSLTASGIGHHKRILMDANHGAAIQPNTSVINWQNCADDCDKDPDCQGIFNPQNYLNLDPTASFFEGSYYIFPDNNKWLNQKYSNIFNNGAHYLGKFKSIDYARTKASEVQAVIDNIVCSKFNQDGTCKYLYGDDAASLHSYLGQSENADYLWFKTYTSIIHGAKGIWFWDLNSYAQNDAQRQLYVNDPTTDVLNASNYVEGSNRFGRNYFPLVYEKFTSHLARELRYLVEQGLLSNDPNTIIASKTDQPDPYCIVPHFSHYIPGGLPAEFQSENYGLRYTIRTNGDEVIMIISNPLPVPLKVKLNFNGFANPITRNATSAEILFANQLPILVPSFPPGTYNQANAVDYKKNRNTGVDWQGSTVGNHFTIPFIGNRQLELSFGALDVHVLRFKSQPPANPDNKWQLAWSNNGSGHISGWGIENASQFIPGDFDGDGKQEFLAVQSINNGSAWATKLLYNNNSFAWEWSNYGSNLIDGWIIAANNKFYAGDFNGDGKDELLCIQSVNSNAKAALLAYSNGNWIQIWNNNCFPGFFTGICNTTTKVWSISNSDNFIVGDFNMDGKSDILAIQSKNNNSWSWLFTFKSSGWSGLWSNTNPVNGKLGNWTINNKDEYYCGDFNADGRSDLFCVRRGSVSASLLYFAGAFSGWTEQWSNNSNNLAGWSFPLNNTDKILAGDLDADGKGEVMFIERCANNACTRAMTMEFTGGQFTQKWIADNPNPYIYDWSIPGDAAALPDYLFITPMQKSFDPRSYLFAMRKYSCNKFLASMYRTDGVSNFRTVESENSKNHVDSVDDTPETEISPNPNSGIFEVRVITGNPEHRIESIRVYNVFGQELMKLNEIKAEEQSYNRVRISADGLTNGIYFVKCLISDGTESVTRINIIH